MRAKQLKSCNIEVMDPEDRISRLPDSVILHILSFLPTRDVIRTSILSRRWDGLWTSVSNLEFYIPFYWKKVMDKFVTFIDRTLIYHESSRIQKFSLVFFYKIRFSSHVDSWIHYAIRKKVEELHLDLSDCSGVNFREDVPYVLPRYFYDSDSFKKLKLNFCVMNRSEFVCWRSLVKLSLRQTVLSDDILQLIFSGCPLLEDIVLMECLGLRRLIIFAPNVKSLTLSDLEQEISISAPYLLSLTISGYIFTAEHSIENASNLQTVKLDFGPMDICDWKDYRYLNLFQILTNILENLSHAKVLSVCYSCIQVLTVCDITKLKTPVSKCKCLTIETGLLKWELPGIANLLRNSPELETLTILIYPSFNLGLTKDLAEKYQLKRKGYWNLQKDSFSCLRHRLKNVNVSSFMVWDESSGRNIRRMTVGCLRKKFEREMELAKFFLKNASVLEKMTFYINKKQNYRVSKLRNTIFDMFQVLLASPRASSSAKVLFL